MEDNLSEKLLLQQLQIANMDLILITKTDEQEESRPYLIAMMNWIQIIKSNISKIYSLISTITDQMLFINIYEELKLLEPKLDELSAGIQTLINEFQVIPE